VRGLRSFALPIARQFIICAIALAPATAANLEAEESKTFRDLLDAEFKSLAEKTNLYVRALNAASNIRRSYDRYDSWVDVQKGPTGKERLVYGLYTINTSPVNDMVEAATRGPTLKPSLPAIDDAVAKLAGATKTLVPLIKAAADYYEQEDYKDDNAKRGQELHGQMMPLFERCSPRKGPCGADSSRSRAQSIAVSWPRSSDRAARITSGTCAIS
jgi:hypothetical protein